MPPRRLLPFVLCLVLLSGCGESVRHGVNALRGGQRAYRIKKLELDIRTKDPGRYVTLDCVGDRAYGWDAVCTYTDPSSGKTLHLGAAFGFHSRRTTGWSSADEPLRYGPHAQALDAAKLAERVDQFCRQRAEDASAFPSPRTTAELAMTAAKLSQLDSLLILRLRSLKPAEDRDNELQSLVGAVAVRSRAYVQIRDALAHGTAALARARADQLVAARKNVKRAAANLGVDCAG
jgi:hypothetical protein